MSSRDIIMMFNDGYALGISAKIRYRLITPISHDLHISTAKKPFELENDLIGWPQNHFLNRP